MVWQVWERDEKDLVYNQLGIFKANSVNRLSNILAMLTLSLLIPYISNKGPSFLLLSSQSYGRLCGCFMTGPVALCGATHAVYVNM